MANDDPVYHRTLNPIKLPQKDVEYIHNRGLDDIVKKYGAYQFQKKALVPIFADQKKDQEFAKYATGWEKLFSKLCSTRHMEPVLDKNGMVIGHYGWMNGDMIFVNPKYEIVDPRLGSLDKLLMNETRVYILKENISWHNDHESGYVYRAIGVADDLWRVVTDITGEVVTYTHYKNRDGAETCWVSPLDIWLIGKLAVNLGVKAIGKVVGSLATRTAAKEAGVEWARLLTEEELAMVKGGGTATPLTRFQVDAAIRRLRAGQSVTVEDLGQMRQIQAELGQLGVRSQSSSHIIPLRTEGVGEGTGIAGKGVFRVDPEHVGAESGHAAYPHINIELPGGGKVDVRITGKLSDLKVTQ